MVTESSLNLKGVIDFWKESRSTDWETVQLEDNSQAWRKDDSTLKLYYRRGKLYEIDAWEFLSFAKQDLEEDSERGRINALSNAKRAIECRIDEFLTILNFRSYSSRKRWGLPYKMQVLQTFDVSAPDVLRDLITSKRNLLEHEYKRPKDRQEVQNIVDIAELFLQARDLGAGYLASATLTRTSWFKPAVFAATWFGGELGQSVTPKYGYHDGYSREYKLEFDLECETITLSYWEKEVYRRCDLKTEKERGRKESVSREEGPVTIPICDCEMEDVRELMILLREKGKANEGI